MKYILLAILMCSFVSAGTMICVDLDDPTAPQNLRVSGAVGAILLEWDASIDTPSCSGIASYIISRDGVEIGFSEADDLNFIDNESLSSGEYTYTVYAIDLVGHNAGAAIKNVISVGSSGRVSSGGGGSSSRCYEDWVCQNWSECVDEYQKRECLDMHKCGTSKDKPLTLRVCNESIIEGSILIEDIDKEENSGFFSTITGAVTGAVGTTGGIAVSAFVVLALGSFFFVRFKRKS